MAIAPSSKALEAAPRAVASLKACSIAKLTLEIGHVSDEARTTLKSAHATWGGQIAAAMAGADSRGYLSLPRHDAQWLARVLLKVGKARSPVPRWTVLLSRLVT